MEGYLARDAQWAAAPLLLFPHVLIIAFLRKANGKTSTGSRDTCVTRITHPSPSARDRRPSPSRRKRRDRVTHTEEFGFASKTELSPVPKAAPPSSVPVNGDAVLVPTPIPPWAARPRLHGARAVTNSTLGAGSLHSRCRVPAHALPVISLKQGHLGFTARTAGCRCIGGRKPRAPPRSRYARAPL